MASLIPELSITEFRKLSASELQELKSCEVTSNGAYLFSFMNSATDFIKASVESLGELSNATQGKTIEEIKGVMDVSLQV